MFQIPCPLKLCWALEKLQFKLSSDIEIRNISIKLLHCQLDVIVNFFGETMAKLVNFKDADIGRRAEKQWHFCAYWCQNGGENVKSGWIYGCKGYEKFRCTKI